MGVQISPLPTVSPTLSSIPENMPKPAFGIVDSAMYKSHSKAAFASEAHVEKEENLIMNAIVDARIHL